jgi:hypothetical protein
MADSKSRTTKAADPAARVETDETGILREDVGDREVTAAVSGGAQDRVAMASRLPDGTPAQTPGFTYIDPEAAKEAGAKQLAEQAVSNADAVLRAPADAGPGEGGEGSSAPDPAVQRIADVHERVAAEAAEKVDAEVDKHSGGQG